MLKGSLADILHYSINCWNGSLWKRKLNFVWIHEFGGISLIYVTSDSMQMDSKNLNYWMEVIIHICFGFFFISSWMFSCRSDMFVMIYVTTINPICPTFEEHKSNFSLHKRTHEITHHIWLKTSQELRKLPYTSYMENQV